MYQKILVPLDGSNRSYTAAVHGVEIASKFNAEVTFLHVIPFLTEYTNKFGDNMGIDFKSLSEELETQGEQLLREAAEDLEVKNVTINKKMVWGNPSMEICNEAKEGDYNLIVLGSRGLGEITGYLMGSVSNRVSRHAPCPVLIIR